MVVRYILQSAVEIVNCRGELVMVMTLVADDSVVLYTYEPRYIWVNGTLIGLGTLPVLCP